jgi:preprotein translocase subunit SecF
MVVARSFKGFQSVPSGNPRADIMEFFRISRTIPFMRHALALNMVSVFFFVLAVFFIVMRGFNLSIEFTGGTVIELTYPQTAPLVEIREELETLGYTDYQVQNFGTSRDVLIRLPVIEGQSASDQSDVLMAALTANTPEIVLQRVEYVGPQIGRELVENGLLALLFVIIGIVVYLAIRFEWKFAVAGVVANIHDVVIILGFFAFFQLEFSLSVLAGVLAVLGYSVNESVVIMDRIRENFRRLRNVEVIDVIDGAITQTMSRTIITHGSTQMMVLSMLIFGGPTLENFALALTIGIWFGIYSSIFVAASIALWLGVKREDLVKPVKKTEELEEIYTED